MQQLLEENSSDKYSSFIVSKTQVSVSPQGADCTKIRTVVSTTLGSIDGECYENDHRPNHLNLGLLETLIPKRIITLHFLILCNVHLQCMCS